VVASDHHHLDASSVALLNRLGYTCGGGSITVWARCSDGVSTSESQSSTQLTKRSQCSAAVLTDDRQQRHTARPMSGAKNCKTLRSKCGGYNSYTQRAQRTWLGRVLQSHQSEEDEPFRREVITGEGGAQRVLCCVKLQGGAGDDALTLASHALVGALCMYVLQLYKWRKCARCTCTSALSQVQYTQHRINWRGS
jgi:hypothetical protein